MEITMEEWIDTSFQSKIDKANLCKLDSIFKAYNLNINKYNTKSICPFKNHKGGRENSASFYFYPKTNSYWCFGCKKGSTSIDFVMNYENCSFIEAVEIINNLDKIKFTETKEKFIDLFSLKLKFSDLIRDTNNYEVMKIYDSLNEQYDLDDESLEIVLIKLIKKMEG